MEAVAESFQPTSIRLLGAETEATGAAGTERQPQASNLKAAIRVWPEPPYSVVNQKVQSSEGSTPMPA